jgi:predicted N-acetyltransferase YhbS
MARGSRSRSRSEGSAPVNAPPSPHAELRLERRFDSALAAEERAQLGELLREAFGEFFAERLFYKQIPQQRIVLLQRSEIVGQCGLDYRAMRADDRVIYTLGAVDLCVRQAVRGRGLGERLLREFLAEARCREVDYALLLARDGRLYRKLGFAPLVAQVRWLAVEDLRSVTVLDETVAGEIYALPVRADAPLAVRELDFLGYMF